jgi:hypothetical protein
MTASSCLELSDPIRDLAAAHSFLVHLIIFNICHLLNNKLTLYQYLPAEPEETHGQSVSITGKRLKA